ncbi:DUF4870 domain-containing protein [Deinococcus sp. Marseille-Q6407]|uniref:DUF4870 domain-containing protein n=1 Tax=Deinococcus sp. Marseille-Q6407 TaxID=2969223 RepID=UPI0021C0F604|nr:DUF4870 domain-containing protein [Deinococcus sp. Marseille-Q6407]
MKRVPPDPGSGPWPDQPAPLISEPAAHGLRAPVPGLGVPSALQADERTPALVIHLSPLLAFVLPAFGNLLGPLAAWLVYRDRSPLLDSQGKEALNFQLSMLIYSFVGTLLLLGLSALGFLGGFLGAAAGSDLAAGMGLFSGAGLLMALLLGGFFLYLLPIVFMVLAALSVSEGQPYRYPLTLRLLK